MKTIKISELEKQLANAKHIRDKKKEKIIKAIVDAPNEDVRKKLTDLLFKYCLPIHLPMVSIGFLKKEFPDIMNDEKNKFTLTFKKGKQTIKFVFVPSYDKELAFYIYDKSERKDFEKYIKAILKMRNLIGNGNYKKVYKSIAKYLLPHFIEDFNKDSFFKFMIKDPDKVEKAETVVKIDVVEKFYGMKKDENGKVVETIHPRNSKEASKDSLWLYFKIFPEIKVYFKNGYVSQPTKMALYTDSCLGDARIYLSPDGKKMLTQLVDDNLFNLTTDNPMKISGVILNFFLINNPKITSFARIRDLLFKYLKRKHGIEMKPIGDMPISDVERLSQSGEALWIMQKGDVQPYIIERKNPPLTDEEEEYLLWFVKHTIDKMQMLSRNPFQNPYSICM